MLMLDLQLGGNEYTEEGESSALKVLSVCQDIQELYQIYENSWFDLEGQIIPIQSVTLQMINKDCDQLDVILFLQMADVTENAIYQTVGTDLTVREASAVYEYSKSAFNCSLSMIAVD